MTELSELPQLRHPVQHRSVYYLRVAGADDADEGSYELAIENRPTDAVEPDDERAEAVPVALNGSVSGEVVANDDHWCVFTAPTAQRIGVRLEKEAGLDTAFTQTMFQAGFHRHGLFPQNSTRNSAPTR